MPRLLYDTETATLQAYPRADDEPVIGLDPRYLEMDALQQPQPEYDPATHRLESTEAIDLDARTVTRGWQVIDLPPTEPVQDWPTFRSSLLINEGVAAVMAAARSAGCEPGVTALPVTLERAQSGDVADFRACWALVAAAGQPSPELLTELTTLATTCHLPEAFISALTPAEN